MALRLNERLHLVIPIYADDSDTITGYVHSAPISREIFEAHFMLISRTFSEIYSKGLGLIAGPRVASLLLNKIAADHKDDPGEALDLMNEIRRLTNVITRGPHGWTSISFQEAVDQKDTLSEEDIAEVTNAIVFFMVASSMHRRQELKEILNTVASVWGARTSSLDFTGFVASLQTSTNVDPIGKAQIAASSVVY